MLRNSPHILELLQDLPGPIVVLGAGGFIGANLTRLLDDARSDIHGLVLPETDAWRLHVLGTKARPLLAGGGGIVVALNEIKPKIIFNLAAHGAYSEQTSHGRIVTTNFEMVVQLSEWAARHSCRLIQAGSSSEYGLNSRAPSEITARPQPNSMYAITKLGASLWLEHMARTEGLQSVTLRLYSVYGRLEEPSRLVPTIIRDGLQGRLPPFAEASVSRDFVYLDDVLEAFLNAAYFAPTRARGLTINICTGIKTTMSDVAAAAKEEFGIRDAPVFGRFSRHWDLKDWVGDASLAAQKIEWTYRTSFAEGLNATRSFYSEHYPYLLKPEKPRSTTRVGLTHKGRISVIVACYRDAQAIPLMYDRVNQALESSEYDFELIFVNDASPDDSLKVIESLSRCDFRIVGITHSRNFGSQSAFLSGMKMAQGELVALLDGDLQDPPELLPRMIALIHEGNDVVFGRRVGRDAPRPMRIAYKAFYRVFSRLSPFPVPRDAGDFSVMTRNVVDVITAMPERDLFIRAQRAYAGFRQSGVDYVRPERAFGKSTNSFAKNVGWAMKGVLAVSRAPLTALSIFGFITFCIALLLIVVQVVTRVFWPDIAPKGLTTISILIVGMGAINILGIAVLGEYIGRILDEVKRRPRYVRRFVTRSGHTQELSNHIED